MFLGVFSTELLASHCKNTESESLDLSIDFFAWFHIVCHRYTSKKVHFTCFNTILPVSLSSPCRTQLPPSFDFLSYGGVRKNLEKEVRPLEFSQKFHSGWGGGWGAPCPQIWKYNFSLNDIPIRSKNSHLLIWTVLRPCDWKPGYSFLEKRALFN